MFFGSKNCMLWPASTPYAHQKRDNGTITIPVPKTNQPLQDIAIASISPLLFNKGLIEVHSFKIRRRNFSPESSNILLHAITTTALGFVQLAVCSFDQPFPVFSFTISRNAKRSRDLS